MTAAELRDAARKAGREGTEWVHWTNDDAVAGEIADAIRGGLRLAGIEEIKAAHAEGRREYCEKSWLSVWTTASERYDFLGTHTVEGPFPWDGKELRRVLMHPHHADSQRARYWSGLCGDWDEDPREVERRVREGLVRDRVERFLLCVRVAAGAAWLASLSDEELGQYDEDERDEVLRGFGLRWEDHRRAQVDRETDRRLRARAKEWARCRALFPDGATLVDEGCPSVPSPYGRVGGREGDAWRSVTVRVDWRGEDAEVAEVHGEGRFVGSLARVAELFARGEVRVAREGEAVPPRAVVDRLGCRYADVRHLLGGTVWVGRPRRVGSEPLVLDDAGHLVRKRAVRDAALRAFYEAERGGR